uniref:Cytochrome P450 90B1 n=1 Tax=Ananas comosus var. bracteatus TaxID=296719 RepID=A0A6V7PZ08_ANACO|nr:unnamed protein product [Ananas comosus var. bracteatus]
MVSADAELNRHVMNNDMRLFENAWPPHIPRLMGKHSTVMWRGDVHKQKKSTILSFMSSARTQSSFVRGVERQAAALVASWKGRDVVYGADEARKFSFYVISKKVMGMNSNNPKTDELSSAFMDLAKGFASIPINLPGTTYYKALKGRAYIGKMVEQKMEEKSRNERKGVDEEDDFVEWMSKNTSYSTEEMIDMTQGLIFAGHHTTARTLSLAFYFLARCPKAIEQMRVISETLRLGNVVRVLLKKASVDTEYKDYVIPQGTGVILHLAAAHLDESVFEDPYEFNPWRWETLSDTKKASFMPFGAGLRHCPGRDLARMEIAIFLHTLIQNYNFELIGPDHPMAKPQVDFRNGLPIKLKPAAN